MTVPTGGPLDAGALPRLSRDAGDAAAAAPVRIVHLGLGNFFRAHQAFYTDAAPDARRWGIAAFTGRSAALADAISAQDGLFTLITRAADGDSTRIIGSISRAHAAADHRAWLGYLADPAVRIVTLTVTEAGYLRAADGHLDTQNVDVRSDLGNLRVDTNSPVRTAPGRLVAGLAARRITGAGTSAIVSCDNLPDNGAVTRAVVTEFAEILDPSLAGWITENVSFVTTMVDRITPATAAGDTSAAAALTGRRDAAPVVTEPFTDWVLSGEFPGGRPAWDGAGAQFVDDVGPYEQRKLWLLNGGHSLLAYAGSARGHRTIAEAVADPICRAWLIEWWNEAAANLTLPAPGVNAYREALLDRFGNPRIRHQLSQIAADGSHKLPIRIIPTLRLERAQGRLPAGALRVLAAWINHLSGAGAPFKDSAAQRLSALVGGPLTEVTAAVLSSLDPALGRDRALISAVVDLCRELSVLSDGGAAGPQL